MNYTMSTKGIAIGGLFGIVSLFLPVVFKIAVIIIMGAFYPIFIAVKTRKKHPEGTSLLVLMAAACFVLAVEMAFKEYLLSHQLNNDIYFWADKLMVALCFSLAFGAILKSVRYKTARSVDKG